MTIRKLDPEHRRLVEFAEIWLPYGGGSREDIFVTFGLTEDQYFQRLCDLLTFQSLAVGLDTDICKRMITVSTARLTKRKMPTR